MAPYLYLMSEDAPQRDYALRDMFNALRYLAHTGCPWHYLPGDLPPWATGLPAADALAGCARA